MQPYGCAAYTPPEYYFLDHILYNYSIGKNAQIFPACIIFSYKKSQIVNRPVAHKKEQPPEAIAPVYFNIKNLMQLTF
ncbi:hypothetical protein BEN74_18030 [Acinetobacter sp. WCHAc010034]|nr:hypothetical protein BEN74_18030 [Acinetobacter sp. WCHAc010034]